jgi:DNA-directed RNA polymerase specialized sigma24 family protein
VCLRIPTRPSPSRSTPSPNICHVSPSPSEVTAAINDLISANRALRSRLLDSERVLAQAVRRIDGGTSPGQVLVTVPSVQQRRASEDAVTALYEARHKVREAVIPAAIADGLSVGDIALAFGVPLDTVVGYADGVATEGRI